MNKLAIAVLIFAVGCSSKIQHGLSERDADEIKAVLDDHGISAALTTEGKDGKWTVEVPQASASEAIRVLRDANLPRAEAPGFSEVFGGGSMVPTATEERAKMIQALSGENARMLEGLEGVIRAKVIVVPETKTSAFGAAEPARASVLLKVAAPKADALTARKAELQQLVAGSVPGLTADHVAVLIEAQAVVARPTIIEHRDERATVAVAAVGGVLVLLLAGGLVFLTLRSRKLRLELDAKAAADEETAPMPTKPAPAAKKAA